MPRFILPLILASLFTLFSSHFFSGVYADGINLYADFEYQNSTSETKNKDTGEVVESESSRFRQLYNLDIQKRIYPNIILRGGGIFELDNLRSFSAGVDSDIDERIIRPFVGLDLTNPVYTAGIGYRRTDIEESITGVQTTRDFRDEYNALLSWRPAGLPRSTLNYIRTETYDSLDTVDRIQDLLSFNTTYDWRRFFLNYTYSFNNVDNRITDFKTLDQAHTGRVDYSRDFFNRRLSLNTSYRISYSSTEFPGTGTGTLPVFRSDGLFSIDSTPSDGPALDSNTALFDGNLTASGGIDIGLAGDETTQTNIGLDFGTPAIMDTLYVWVDRALTSTIANSFSWEIYTSPDNTDASTWTLYSTEFPAPFGVFNNRFEITFPEVETRFIKVVTRPLSPVVIDAAGFPNIFVTEIEALSTISSETAEKISTIGHYYNLGLLWRLSEKTSAGYNFYYSMREKEPISERDTLISNGINISHRFSGIFTGSARLLRTDSMRRDVDSTSYNYGALLRADYLETFSQRLSYSGTNLKEDDGLSSTNTVLLRNIAELYKGWNANLDLGYSWSTPLEGGRRRSTLLRLETNIIPNQKLTLDINYSVTRTVESGEPVQLRQTGILQASFLPMRTLSLFARITVQELPDSTDIFQNYSVNWSPFPDGAIQFFVNYNEILSPDEEEDTIMGAGLRWSITRKAFLEVSYNIIESKSLSEIVDSKNLLANLRISL